MKRKSKPTRDAAARMRAFLVYGKFESRAAGGSTLERWVGRSRSISVAIRRAVSEFKTRPGIRWGHFSAVTIQAQPIPIHEFEHYQKQGQEGASLKLGQS